MNSTFKYILIFLLFLSNVALGQQRKNTKIKETDIVPRQLPDGVVWRKMVLRQIDITDSQNMPLQHLQDSAGGNTNINMLFYGMVKKRIAPTYNLAGDSVVVMDSVLELLERKLEQQDTMCIRKYVILEDWQCKKDGGQMIVNIVYIGPYLKGYGKAVILPDLKDFNFLPCVSPNYQPFFAMKYMDIHNELLRYKVTPTTGKNHDEVTLLDYFTNRYFSSKIICLETHSLEK